MCHNFVLVYLSNISFYVYSRTTNIPFSDVSHIKFSLFTVCSVVISILDSPISEEHHQLYRPYKNSNNIHFRS